MHPAVAPALLTFGSALALGGYIAARRERSALRVWLLALLAALAVWSLGSILRFSVATPAGVWSALHVVFLGSFFAPPLWFLAMHEIARPVRGEASARRSLLSAALLAPSALFYLAFLTNDAHRLVLRHPDPDLLVRGPLVWAGPLFWSFVATAYAFVAAGALILWRGAGPRAAEYRYPRVSALWAAALLPVVASSAYVFQWVPIRFDPTPSLLGVSVLLISLSVFRYELLESSPLARRDLIEHLDEGVLLASPEGRVLVSNSAAAALLGAERRALAGRDLAEALSGLAGAGEAERPSRLDALASSQGSERIELAGPSGRRVEVRVAALRGESGRVVGRLAVLRDRTQERRDELQGRHAQMLDSLGTLAAGIAHEVNNPLAYIRANLSQVQRMGEQVEAAAAAGGPEAKLAAELADLREIAEETLDGIERIGSIVADIRTLGGVSRNDVFGELSLNQVASDALRLSNLHRDPAIQLETALAEPLPAVEGSAPRLVQAVLNLLINARQALAGRDAARISIESRVEPAFVALRVGDNGAGISPELQERIFDPFFSTKGPGRGTGLGLSISLDIARDHGGSLRVESAPGQGTVFELRLPRRPGDVGGAAGGR